MKFLVDNQLPLQLARHLRSRGHETEHVSDVGLVDATDLAIWTWAVDNSFIVVSKDDDFVFLSHRHGDRGRLLWVRLGNCRKAALLAAWDQFHETIVAAFASGQRIVELR